MTVDCLARKVVGSLSIGGKPLLGVEHHCGDPVSRLQICRSDDASQARDRLIKLPTGTHAD
ncbi:hypothetical protein [Mycetohabitans sp. B46]|uniref:hypothetical protein n=1 Tax=Mycetohabitans sp. B46 TaxID=2772536 RepID=UPI00307F60A1